MSNPSLTDPIALQLQATIASGRLMLPMLPTVATGILASVDGDDCDARSLAQMVQRDPSLAAHVLRVANSALYAPTEPIESLTQAIGRLGLNKLRELVVLIAVKAAVFSVPGHETYVTQLWLHAHMSARMAREIAHARRDDVEAAFLCGLLHNIGAPVVLQGLVDLCRDADLPLDTTLIESVVASLQAAVGARLIDEWRLPESVREVALHYQQPESASAHHELVLTVALADLLSDWLIESDAEGLPPGLEYAEALNLRGDQLDALWATGTHMLAEFAGGD